MCTIALFHHRSSISPNGVVRRHAQPEDQTQPEEHVLIRREKIRKKAHLCSVSYETQMKTASHPFNAHKNVSLFAEPFAHQSHIFLESRTRSTLQSTAC